MPPTRPTLPIETTAQPTDYTALPTALIGVVSPYDPSPLPTHPDTSTVSSVSTTRSYTAERRAYAAATDEEKLRMEAECLAMEIKDMKEDLRQRRGMPRGSFAAGDASGVEGGGDGEGEGEGEGKGKEGAAESVRERCDRLAAEADGLWCELRGMFDEEAEDGDRAGDCGDGTGEASGGSGLDGQGLATDEPRPAEFAGLSIDSDPELIRKYINWLGGNLAKAEHDRDTFMNQRDELVTRYLALKAVHAEALQTLNSAVTACEQKNEALERFRGLVEGWKEIAAALEGQGSVLYDALAAKERAIATHKALTIELIGTVRKRLLTKWTTESCDDAVQDLDDMISAFKICDETRDVRTRRVLEDTTHAEYQEQPSEDTQQVTDSETGHGKDDPMTEANGPNIRERVVMISRAWMETLWNFLARFRENAF